MKNHRTDWKQNDSDVVLIHFSRYPVV